MWARPPLGCAPWAPPPPLPMVRLLARCVDVHPHPRPLRVTISNITELRAHWAKVAE